MSERAMTAASGRFHGVPEPDQEETLTVAEAMRGGVVQVTAEFSVRAARAVARLKKADHLVITDGGRPLGVVCMRDLVDAVDGDRIATWARSPVAFIDPDASLRHARSVMTKNRLSFLVVSAGAFLVGILTRAGLEATCARAAGQAAAQAAAMDSRWAQAHVSRRERRLRAVALS